MTRHFPNRSLSPKATKIQVAENSNLSRNFVNQQITYKTRSKPHLTKPSSDAMSKTRAVVELNNRSSKERGTRNPIPIQPTNQSNLYMNDWEKQKQHRVKGNARCYLLGMVEALEVIFTE